MSADPLSVTVTLPVGHGMVLMGGTVPLSKFAEHAVPAALVTPTRMMYGEPYAATLALLLAMLFVAGSKVTRVTTVLLLSLLTVTKTGAELLCANVPSPL